MRRVTNLVAWVMAVSLAASALVGGTRAEAAPRDRWVVKGKVVVAHGAPAIIQPSIWPKIDAPSREGQRVPMLDLPAVYTHSGHYRIQIERAALPNGYVNPDGTIQVRLVVSDCTTAEIQETSVFISEAAAKKNQGTVDDPAASADTVDFVNPLLRPQVKPDDPAPRVQFKSATLLPRVTPEMIESAPANDSVVVDVSSIAALATTATGGSCWIYEGPYAGPYN